MTQSSILFFTDPHNSDTPPRMRRERYREQILYKQEMLIEPAKKADIVIIGGDIFHQKKPHKISYYLVNRLLEIYREYGETYIVPGNHDFDMRPEEISDNPLGVLGKLPNIKLMHGALENVRGMDIFFKGLGDFEGTSALSAELSVWYDCPSDNYRVAVIHDSVATKKYPFEIQAFESIEKYADLFFFGHLHTWQELGGKIVAPGALSRGTLEKDSIDRTVNYAWVSVDTEERRHVIKGYPLPVKSAEEVFRVEDYAAKKSLEQSVENFIERLKTYSNPEFITLDIDAAIKLIEGFKIDEKVKKKAIDILRSL